MFARQLAEPARSTDHLPHTLDQRIHQRVTGTEVPA